MRLRTTTPGSLLASFRSPEPTPEQEEAAREFERAQERERWAERLRASGIPAEFRHASIAAFPGEIAGYAAGFSESTRSGLLLHGPYGTGKTTAACAVAIQVARRWQVRFATAPELVARAGTFDRDAMSPYRNTRLLVLDDLGKERPTEFAMEQVYSLVDYRWREGKPTIVTTNHDGASLRRHFAKIADEHTASAIMSRIIGMCRPVEMPGGDRRSEKNAF